MDIIASRILLKKMCQTRPLFVYFVFFSHYKYSTNNINYKSIDGVIGTRTWGGRMVGADKSTELHQGYLSHSTVVPHDEMVAFIRPHRFCTDEKC